MNRFLILVVFLAAIVQMGFCQSVSVIEGKIIDATTNEPVPFASVGVKGYPYGTSSNADGAFQLRIPSLMRTSLIVSISCIGYETKEIPSPQVQMSILLQPSPVQLKNVLVMSKDLRPEKIVQRAFQSIKKNYNTKPFVYKSFYRHYCKDDGLYGRLIEGAVDIYRKKGYRVQQSTPGEREEVRIAQLRRSYDNTKIKSTHRPIALYSVMGADPVSYQVKVSKKGFDFFQPHEVSTIRRRIKDFDFSLDGVVEYDGQEVYMIRYALRMDTVTVGSGFKISSKQEGTLYVNTKDYAIVKSEWARYAHDTIRTVTIYKKFQGKYYLQYIKKEGSAYRASDQYKHYYHLELMTSEIVLKGFEKFKGREPDREGLLEVNYDSTFWNTYNILKATPVEESIASDLQRNQPLEKQYEAFLSEERDRVLGGKEDEERFNQFLSRMRGIRPVYIDLWASWCGPCIREMNASRELFEKYKTRISFVYVSIDHDIEAWRKMLDRLALDAPAMKHFRVGPQGDVMKTFDITAIPRYILVDRKGNFVNLDAPRPSDPKLIQEFERLMAE